MNYKSLATLIIVLVVVGSGTAYFVSTSRYYQKDPAKTIEAKESSETSAQVQLGKESVSLFEAIAENPMVKQFVENNPAAQEVLNKVQSAEQTTQEMCKQFNNSGYDFENLNAEMLKPVYGDKAQSYVNLLKEVAKACGDGNISSAEGLSLINVMNENNIDPSQFGF